MNYSNGLTAAGTLTAAYSAIKLLDLPKTFQNCAPDEKLKQLCINILKNPPGPLTSFNPAGELEKRAKCTEWKNSPTCDEYDSYFNFFATILTVSCLVVALNIIFKKCHRRQSRLSLETHNGSAHQYRERQVREKHRKIKQEEKVDSAANAGAHSTQKGEKVSEDQNNNAAIKDQSDQKTEDKKDETGTTSGTSEKAEVDPLEMEWAKVKARVEKLQKKAKQ